MKKSKPKKPRALTCAPVALCEWFAGCTNPATGTTPHPVLGSVPTCDRCHQFATGTPRDVHPGAASA